MKLYPLLLAWPLFLPLGNAMAADAQTNAPGQRIVDFTAGFEKQRFAQPPTTGLVNRALEVPMNEYKPFKERTSAGSCRPTNLSKEMGPVRNQSGMGWCFASVAADILSHAVKKRLSDVDLSLQYFRLAPKARVNSDNKPIFRSIDEVPANAKKDSYVVDSDPSVTEFWAGQLHTAVNLGANLGICSEAEVSSADFLYNKRIEDAVLENTPFPNASTVTRHALQAIESLAGTTLDRMALDAESTCDSVIAAQRLVPALNTWQIIGILSSAS
ncbi:MAG: hypothetical protein EOP11_18685, partial [Proteobacteria bacterium]